MKKETDERFRGAGKVAFHARMEGIKEMLDKQYPKIVIYRKYKDELNIEYSQFIRYVKRYIEIEHHGNKRKEPSKPTKDVPNKTTTATHNPHKEKEKQDGKKDEGRKSASISDILKSTDDLDDL